MRVKVKCDLVSSSTPGAGGLVELLEGRMASQRALNRTLSAPVLPAAAAAAAPPTAPPGMFPGTDSSVALRKSGSGGGRLWMRASRRRTHPILCAPHTVARRQSLLAPRRSLPHCRALQLLRGGCSETFPLRLCVLRGISGPHAQSLGFG